MIPDWLLGDLRAAEYPSALLDEQILRACGWTARKTTADEAPHSSRYISGWCWFDEEGVPYCDYAVTPNVTSSVDAALLTVPKGWNVEMHWGRDRAPNVVMNQFPEPCRRIQEERPWAVTHRTLPLAICLVSLEARR
jgi:hypothetical protein